MVKPVDIIFPEAAKLKSDNKCPLCKEAIGKFRNAASEKEFKISGMCQKCQDMIFGID